MGRHADRKDTALADRSVIHGDSLTVMPTLEPVDAIVCDPPYGLKFMGKGWDHGVPGVPFWEAALGCSKPGAYLLAFGGTRTHHRLACAIEDAGWEIRDTLMWLYGSGFPKGKACLKPGWEPIILARRPGKSAHLQIEACRLPTTDCVHVPGPNGGQGGPAWRGLEGRSDRQRGEYSQSLAGRWPANVVLSCECEKGGRQAVCRASPLKPIGADERPYSPTANPNIHGPSCPVAMLDAQSGERTRSGGNRNTSKIACGYNGLVAPRSDFDSYRDTGGASRFFYCAKASRAERNAGCDDLPGRVAPSTVERHARNIEGNPKVRISRQNHHPTVKPLALMRWLCRLVTPPGGLIIDPFCGSGSTGCAAVAEGFRFVGIEREVEYVAIAERRIAHWTPEPAFALETA